MSTLGQDTKKIVPLDTAIAKEVVKDLERYDLCVIQRQSLHTEANILKEKISKKDSVVRLQESVNDNLGKVITAKDTVIMRKNKRIQKLKAERNVTIGAIVIGIILTAIIAG